MAMQVKDFLSFYNLLEKLIPYVKDESGNLMTLARILPSIINYIFMAFFVFWQGSCFDHAFSKTYMSICLQ
jgi:hypothetical protein